MEPTVNHILFLYWNHQISREQTLEYLADIPTNILAEWIDDLVNRVDEAMSLATLADRLDYPDGRPLPTVNIHERILEAAKRFCFKGRSLIALSSSDNNIGISSAIETIAKKSRNNEIKNFFILDTITIS